MAVARGGKRPPLALARLSRGILRPNPKRRDLCAPVLPAPLLDLGQTTHELGLDRLTRALAIYRAS